MEFLKTLFEAFNAMPFIFVGVVTGGIYNYFKRAVLMGSFKLEGTQANTTPIYCALLNNSYSPDVDNHKYLADCAPSSFEVGGAGYSTGGAALSSPVTAIDDAGNYCKLDATDWTLGNATITARYGVLYSSVGAASACPLIAYFDFGADQSASAGNFTITWASGGILQLT